MVEKKEIKTKKEMEMEKAEGEEVPVEKVEKIETEPETKSEWEMKAERGKGTAQKFFEDMITTFRERGGDFERALSEYTAAVPSKLTMDVIETDDNIIVKTDLPGVKKEDIIIDLTEDSLEIIAKFEEESKVEGKNFVKKERRYGEARRSLVLPDVVKVKEASAKFDNGVLTVILPKLEEKKRFQVKVE